MAGIVAAFVPGCLLPDAVREHWAWHAEHTFPEVLQHALVAPAAAFLTFIGSMGNIPLAVLFGAGEFSPGVMAFIFSDLVVFPVLRINARYYGWRMSLFILALLLVALVARACCCTTGWPGQDTFPRQVRYRIQDTTFFAVDHTPWLNLAFLLASAGILWHASRHGGAPPRPCHGTQEPHPGAGVALGGVRELRLVGRGHRVVPGRDGRPTPAFVHRHLCEPPTPSDPCSSAPSASASPVKDLQASMAFYEKLGFTASAAMASTTPS